MHTVFADEDSIRASYEMFNLGLGALAERTPLFA
jgi:hypothetical protein